MAFSQDILPVDIAPGASVDTQYRTTITESGSGSEFRTRRWANPLRYFEVAYNVRSRQRIEDELQRFVLERGGALEGFLARDWSDHRVTNQYVATGDGVTYWFRLRKDYGTYQRRILKPDPTTVTVSFDGRPVDPDTYVSDADNGLLIFRDAPPDGQVIRWSGEFFVPVRFLDDSMPVQMLIHSKGRVSDVGLRELRIYEDIDEAEIETVRDFMRRFDITDLGTMLDILRVHVNINWPATQ